MFSHMMVGSNDIAKSRKFYDALVAALGGNPAIEDDKGRLVYVHDRKLFMVSRPIDGQPATHANGGTIGFTMLSTDLVEAWHKAGTENGGISVEDPPGVRPSPMGDLYLAYLRDPDGNKLCAVHRMTAG
ncbi:MAG TPA: VOC family protein [Allosphingosinicella sp.]